MTRRLLLVLSRVIAWFRALMAARASDPAHAVDAPTLLLTRSAFELTLSAALAAVGSDGNRGNLAILDVRDFYRINLALGHRHGDELLRQLAGRLRSALPASTPLARLSGDVFGVLLTGAWGGGEPTQAARRLLAILQAPFDLNGVPVEIETYCGVAIFPQHGESSALLLQHAESALRAAKDQGELIGVYQPQDETGAARRVQMFGALRLALQRAELTLRYQPKAATDSGTIVGCEALLSWHSPQLGQISPSEFIPLAEQTSLIKPLTNWVIGRAVQQIAEWRKEGLEVRVAVNLSAKNLTDSALPNEVARLLQEHGVPAQSLVAEITESAVLVDPERAAGVIEQLTGLGVALSLDDFGTGYSSLTYLRLLPATELKLDRSFVSDVDTNPNSAAIVRGITQLAHQLDMSVVAEGVETEAVASRIRELGCDVVQGYLISRPLLATDFADFVRARRAAASRLALPRRVAAAPRTHISVRPPGETSLRDSLRLLRAPSAVAARSEPPPA